MSRQRIALLGVAHVHAAAYATWFTQQEDMQVVGFSEENPELAAEFAALIGLPALTLAEALAAAPHGVVVCSETVRHRANVEAAAQAGAQILCEKPIATTLADAQTMQDACQRAGVQFFTAFPARYSSAVQQLKTLLTRNALGEILVYSSVNHSICPDTERAWFSDLALAGGGAGMDHIIHLADLLHFFGEEVESVYARLRPVPTWTRMDHDQTDAAGLVTLRLTSGAAATIDCSWSRPPSYPRWGHLKLEVVGTEGMRSLDAFAEHLTVYRRTEARWAGYGHDLNAQMLTEFLRACGGESPRLLADWAAGEQALRVVLAAYQSEQTGQAVKVSEVTA